MTVPETRHPVDDQSDWLSDTEIQMRQLIDILLSWWKEILLFGLIGALVGGISILIARPLSDPDFQARSTLIMARVSSEANFDERFRIVSDGEELSAADNSSRRNALLGLVKSGAVAQAVINEIGEQLSVAVRTPEALLNQIQAEVVQTPENRSASDLIAITATADTPEKAVLLADTWAKHYVAHVNGLYNRIPLEVLDSVNTELATADGEFLSAQSKLQDFIAQNRIPRLNREINEKQNVLNTLQTARDAAFVTSINEELTRAADRLPKSD